jgi:IS1 family transposase
MWEPLGAESTGRVPVGSRRLHDCVGDAGRRPGPRWAARDPGRCHGRRGHTGPCRPRQRPRRRREVARAQKTRPHRWRWNARERATGQGRAWAGGRREQAPLQRRVARLAPWAGTFEGTEPWQVSASVCPPEPLVRRHAQTAGRERHPGQPRQGFGRGTRRVRMVAKSTARVDRTRALVARFRVKGDVAEMFTLSLIT